MSGDSEVAFECVVSADLFSRAQLGISTEETRYYLNGVHVSPAPEGGAVICATDGSMLIVLHDPDAYISGEAIVKLNPQMVRALPVIGGLIERRLLAVRVMKGELSKAKAFVVDQRSPAQDEGFATAHLAARTVFDDPDSRVRAAQFGPLTIDGNFPDWRRVLPTDLDPAVAVGWFDEAKLAKLAKALCVGKRNASIILTGSRSPNSPMLVTSATIMVTGFAILMPTRETAKAPPQVPAWALKPIAEAA